MKKINYLFVLILMLAFACGSKTKEPVKQPTADISEDSLLKDTSFDAVNEDIRETPKLTTTKDTAKTKVVKTTKTDADIIEIHNSTPEKDKKFYLVIGSFKEKANALKQQTHFAKLGYKPTIMEAEKGFYRVSLGVYKEEKVARKELKQIRKKYKDTKFWLLKM